MLNPTAQHRLDLISGMGAMLIDICRTNRLDPEPLCYEMLCDLARKIKKEADDLFKAEDDARFQKIWGDHGSVAQTFPVPTVPDAWARICATGIDEGMDDLSRNDIYI